MLEQIVIIIVFIFLIKAISFLFDKPSPNPNENPDEIPSQFSDTEKRKFQWNFDDNINTYSLGFEIEINVQAVIESREELYNETPPSKIIFYSDQDYFNVAAYEVLHEKFGIGSNEIDQICNHLKKYADTNYFSNYLFTILILSFVHEQNIKYSYDEESTGNVEYVRFPIETIYDTTGDCDCKAVLASVLFKKLGYRVAFALMPGHAALAISSETIPLFANFEMNGTKWFYCEATGDYWKPGQIPDGIQAHKIKLREL